MAMSRRNRKQSWVGMEDEKPYAYLREAMVKKLLKGICEPQNIIEDYQHRDLFVQESRKRIVAEAVGRWDFSAHDFTEDELVYAGYYMLNHCLEMEACEQWSMNQRKCLINILWILLMISSRRPTTLHARLPRCLQFFRPLPQL